MNESKQKFIGALAEILHNLDRKAASSSLQEVVGAVPQPLEGAAQGAIGRPVVETNTGGPTWRCDVCAQINVGPQRCRCGRVAPERI